MTKTVMMMMMMDGMIEGAMEGGKLLDGW